MKYPESECRIGHGGLEFDRRQLETALEAAVEASRRQAREPALADALAWAASSCSTAQANAEDLTPHVSALSAAMSLWRNRSSLE